MKKTIILNAGHNNAADCGAAANGTTEAAEAIKIRDKLIPLLKQNFEVILVPDELDLKQSIKWVNEQCKKLEDGLAFSIHLNAGGGTGAEIFYYANNEISQNIAKTIIDKYCDITGFRNRGAKADITTRWKRLGWIRDVNPWSCLIEVCFIDSIEDLKRLQNDYNKVAWAIYSGICSVYDIKPVELIPGSPSLEEGVSNGNLEKLNNYFEKYIDGMIIKDIELIKAKNNEFKFSYPYILLVCSVIDLLGGIEKDFSQHGRSNSKERFIWFITEWMGEINNLYKEQSLAYLIYESWRCGVVHQATLKKGFETSSYLYRRDKHLHYIEDKDKIFVHSLQFADDFIKAQKMYREYINDNVTNTGYIDLLYGHLLNMMEEYKDKKKQNFDEFTEILKSRNLVFNSSDTGLVKIASSSVPKESTSPSEQMITRLPGEDDIEPIPSTEPREEDLE